MIDNVHNIRVTFHAPQDIDDSLLKFAVIAARYQGQWVMSRHGQRSTWEIPGGHREPGEVIADTARRELWEETGIREADLRPVCVYAVERSGVPTYGMLYFAEVHSLGTIPEGSEIAETQLFPVLPKQLTYPAIQPHLHHRVQAWLNIQSSAGELWDVYDKDRHLTGRIHRRGDPVPKGDYHLVVHVWVQNAAGEYLLTKRSPTKGFPNMWEATGGSALAGDDSLTAALREVKEETGLALDPACGRILLQYSGEDYHTDVWLFRQEYDLDRVQLLEGETCGKRAASAETILALRQAGEFVPFSYLDKLLGGAK